MRTMAKIISFQLFKGNAYREIRKEFVDEWSLNNKDAYLNSINAMLHWTVVDRLKNIMLKKSPTVYYLVIEDARHALPVEKAEVFNSEVHKFIKSIS